MSGNTKSVFIPRSSSCRSGPFNDAADSDDCNLLRRLRPLRLLRNDLSRGVGEEVRLLGDIKLLLVVKLLRGSGESVSYVLDRAKLVALGND